MAYIVQESYAAWTDVTEWRAERCKVKVTYASLSIPFDCEPGDTGPYRRRNLFLSCIFSLIEC